MKTIHHVVDIADDAADVHRRVTTQEGLAGWWSTAVDVEAAEVGAVIRFTFMEGFNPSMEITAIEPDRGVTWRCVDGHDPWRDNTFRFELEPVAGDRTRLRFWQDYAVELDDDEYGIYNFNWGYYLHSLQQLCETGTGTPFEP